MIFGAAKKNRGVLYSLASIVVVAALVLGSALTSVVFAPSRATAAVATTTNNVLIPDVGGSGINLVLSNNGDEHKQLFWLTFDKNKFPEFSANGYCDPATNWPKILNCASGKTQQIPSGIDLDYVFGDFHLKFNFKLFDTYYGNQYYENSTPRPGEGIYHPILGFPYTAGTWGALGSPGSSYALSDTWNQLRALHTVTTRNTRDFVFNLSNISFTGTVDGATVSRDYTTIMADAEMSNNQEYDYFTTAPITMNWGTPTVIPNSPTSPDTPAVYKAAEVKAGNGTGTPCNDASSGFKSPSPANPANFTSTLTDPGQASTTTYRCRGNDLPGDVIIRADNPKQASVVYRGSKPQAFAFGFVLPMPSGTVTHVDHGIAATLVHNFDLKVQATPNDLGKKDKTSNADTPVLVSSQMVPIDNQDIIYTSTALETGGANYKPTWDCQVKSKQADDQSKTAMGFQPDTSFKLPAADNTPTTDGRLQSKLKFPYNSKWGIINCDVKWEPTINIKFENPIDSSGNPITDVSLSGKTEYPKEIAEQKISSAADYALPQINYGTTPANKYRVIRYKVTTGQATYQGNTYSATELGNLTPNQDITIKPVVEINPKITFQPCSPGAQAGQADVPVYVTKGDALNDNSRIPSFRLQNKYYFKGTWNSAAPSSGSYSSDAVNKYLMNSDRTVTAECGPITDPAKVIVDNPASLVQQDKDKIIEVLKATNPDAGITNVEFGTDGNITITAKDGSTSTIAVADVTRTLNVPELDQPAVGDGSIKIKPETGKSFTVGDVIKIYINGREHNHSVIAGEETTGFTYSLPDGPLFGGEVIHVDNTPAAGVPISSAAANPAVGNTVSVLAKPEKTLVKNPDALTGGEHADGVYPAGSDKAKVAAAVRAANPNLLASAVVTVADNGDVTVSYPQEAAYKPSYTNTTIKQADTVKLLGEVTVTFAPGANATAGTGSTSYRVFIGDSLGEDPGKDPGNQPVPVITAADGYFFTGWLGNDGNTYTAAQIAEKHFSADATFTAQYKAIVVPARVIVDDPATLKAEDKAKIAEVVKAANPDATKVVVNDDGTISITTADGKVNTIAVADVTRTLNAPNVANTAVNDTNLRIDPPADKSFTAGDVIEISINGVVFKHTVAAGETGGFNIDLTALKTENPGKASDYDKLFPDNKITGGEVIHVDNTPAAGVPISSAAANPVVGNTISVLAKPEKTLVKNPDALTGGEHADGVYPAGSDKAKVAAAVRAANPNLLASAVVTVADNGDVNITYPFDNDGKPLPSGASNTTPALTNNQLKQADTVVQLEDFKVKFELGDHPSSTATPVEYDVFKGDTLGANPGKAPGNQPVPDYGAASGWYNTGKWTDTDGNTYTQAEIQAKTFDKPTTFTAVYKEILKPAPIVVSNPLSPTENDQKILKEKVGELYPNNKGVTVETVDGKLVIRVQTEDGVAVDIPVADVVRTLEKPSIPELKLDSSSLRINPPEGKPFTKGDVIKVNINGTVTNYTVTENDLNGFDYTLPNGGTITGGEIVHVDNTPAAGVQVSVDAANPAVGNTLTILKEPAKTPVKNINALTGGEPNNDGKYPAGSDKAKVAAAVRTANPNLPADAVITVADKGDVTVTYPKAIVGTAASNTKLTQSKTVSPLGTVQIIFDPGNNAAPGKATTSYDVFKGDKLGQDDPTHPNSTNPPAQAVPALTGDSNAYPAVDGYFNTGNWSGPAKADGSTIYTSEEIAKLTFESGVTFLPERKPIISPAPVVISDNADPTDKDKQAVETAFQNLTKDGAKVYPDNTTFKVVKNDDGTWVVKITTPDGKVNEVSLSTVTRKLIAPEVKYTTAGIRIEPKENKKFTVGDVIKIYVNGTLDEHPIKAGEEDGFNYDGTINGGEVVHVDNTPAAGLTTSDDGAKATGNTVTVVKDPVVTLVKNMEAVTDAEKEKVIAEVKKANPKLPEGTTITVSNQGDVTITYPTVPNTPGTPKTDRTITQAKAIKQLGSAILSFTPGTAPDAADETAAHVDLRVFKGDAVPKIPGLSKYPAADGYFNTGNWIDKDGKVWTPAEIDAIQVDDNTPNYSFHPQRKEIEKPASAIISSLTNPTDKDKETVIAQFQNLSMDGAKVYPEGTKFAVVEKDGKQVVQITTPDGKVNTVPLVDVARTLANPNIGELEVGATELNIVPTTGKPFVPGDIVKITINGQTIDHKIKAGEENGFTYTIPALKGGEIIHVDNTPDPDVVSSESAKKSTGNTITVVQMLKRIPVKDTNALTQADKDKVIEEVKNSNPNLPADAKITVDDKGNVTITYPKGENTPTEEENKQITTGLAVEPLPKFKVIFQPGTNAGTDKANTEYDVFKDDALGVDKPNGEANPQPVPPLEGDNNAYPAANGFYNTGNWIGPEKADGSTIYTSDEIAKLTFASGANFYPERKPIENPQAVMISDLNNPTDKDKDFLIQQFKEMTGPDPDKTYPEGTTFKVELVDGKQVVIITTPDGKVNTVPVADVARTLATPVLDPIKATDTSLTVKPEEGKVFYEGDIIEVKIGGKIYTHIITKEEAGTEGIVIKLDTPLVAGDKVEVSNKAGVKIKTSESLIEKLDKDKLNGKALTIPIPPKKLLAKTGLTDGTVLAWALGLLAIASGAVLVLRRRKEN